MKFEEVLPALREGKKIRRNFWREDTYFYKNHQGTIIFKNGGEDTYYYNLTCLLDSNDWEIVKEKKKVKLRDLTEEQYRTFVDSECRNKKTCNGCLFYYINCSICDKVDKCWINHKDLYSDKFLDQEVEIEVDKKQYKITLTEFFNSKELSVIHCSTEEKANILLKAFDKLGKKWDIKHSYLEDNYYEVYKNETCYSNSGGYGNYTFYKEHAYGIYEFEDVDLEE